jgi:hypothetical protein
MTLKEVMCNPTIYIILMMLMNIGHAPHGVTAFFKVCFEKIITINSTIKINLK